MHRFYAPPAQCQGTVVTLEGAEARHALHVLRVKRGESITVLDGHGSRLLCEVGEGSVRTVQLRVLEREKVASPPCALTLFQALPKGKTFDNIIHKATELGVRRIVPIVSDRVIARPHAEESARKASKWQATAIEAIKQCGQAWLPEVMPSMSLKEAVLRAETSALELVGSLLPGSRHPKSVFEAFAGADRKPAGVGVWVGPEGDFTPEELEAVIRRGARPVTLGDLVLKCETAAVYLLAIVRYETT